MLRQTLFTMIDRLNDVKKTLNDLYENNKDKWSEAAKKIVESGAMDDPFDGRDLKNLIAHNYSTRPQNIDFIFKQVPGGQELREELGFDDALNCHDDEEQSATPAAAA